MKEFRSVHCKKPVCKLSATPQPGPGRLAVQKEKPLGYILIGCLNERAREYPIPVAELLHFYLFCGFCRES